MKFKINGTDISGWIKAEGLTWQRNDVEGPNAGRNMDATMIRDRKAQKITWSVPIRPLRKYEVQQLLTLINPEYVFVECDDPLWGDDRTAYFYSNNVPAAFKFTDANGTEWWDGISFPLVEV